MKVVGPYKNTHRTPEQTAYLCIVSIAAKQPQVMAQLRFITNIGVILL